MPHKHKHSGQGVDAERIRQYLAGELDNKAMHDLERQALDDPFLAEALEGYALHRAEQQANLQDLENRLQQRVRQTAVKGRVRPLYYRWAAAAAVLVLLGLGLVYMWRQQAPQQNGIARTEESVPQPESSKMIAGRVPAAADSAPGASAAAMAAPAAPADAIKPQSPAPAARNGATSRRQATLSAETAAAGQALPQAAAPAIAADEQKDKDTAAAFALNDSQPAAAVAYGYKKAAPAMAPEKSEAAATRLLKGQVKDARNNQGIAGVAVNVAGTSRGALTDSEGNFSIAVNSGQDVDLAINYIGYTPRRLEVNQATNNLQITIKPDSTAPQGKLTGLAPDAGARIAYRAPLPAAGMEAYKNYLANNLLYPPPAEQQQVKGKVRITFTVKGDGTLGNFRIAKKLQPDCDTAALKAVKEGPAWLPASDGRPARVSIEVAFPPANNR